MRLLLPFLFAVCLFVAGAICLPAERATNPFAEILGTTPAAAQSAKRQSRRSLFQILFGRKKAKKKAVKRKTKRKSKRKSKTRKKASVKRKKKTKSKNNTVAKKTPSNSKKRKKRKKVSKRKVKRAAIAAPVIVQKSENAKTVLIVGDFFSSHLAKGLNVALKKNSEIVLVDRSKGLSGFVRNDIVDWPTKLPELVTEIKPDFIIAMVGSNDRQLMRENGKRLKKLTPEWGEAYQKRVVAFGNALKASNAPFIWVGLPPVRFKKMNKDFLYFNELYAKSAASPKGKFIDVWDGFSDEEGNYSRSGPDVSGQIVLLRPKDGINMTKAGRRRLAFYVEGLVTKTLGTGGDVFANSSLEFDIESSLPKTETYNPNSSGKTVVIRLDDPKNDGTLSLAGKKVELDNGSANVSSLPQLSASTPTVQHSGRADNYAWPPSDAPRSSTPALASSE